MVYILKSTRGESRMLDAIMKAQHDKANPPKPKVDPIYREMQHVTDKIKYKNKLIK